LVSIGPPVLADLLVDVGLFPAHAAGRPPLASAKPDLLVARLRQRIHIAADLHVRLEDAGVQLDPEMFAQRLFADAKLLGDAGLGETKSRGTLNERALGIGRLKFGWRLPFHVRSEQF
jgi:hypothetical protein